MKTTSKKSFILSLTYEGCSEFYFGAAQRRVGKVVPWLKQHMQRHASVRTNKIKILLCLVCPQLYFNHYAAMKRPMKNSAVSYLHQ